MNEKKKLNYLAICLLVVIICILLGLKETILKKQIINYPAIIVGILILIQIIFGVLILPKNEKRFWVPMGVGTGWTINPRNKIGLLVYLILLFVIGYSVI